MAISTCKLYLCQEIHHALWYFAFGWCCMAQQVGIVPFYAMTDMKGLPCHLWWMCEWGNLLPSTCGGHRVCHVGNREWWVTKIWDLTVFSRSFNQNFAIKLLKYGTSHHFCSTACRVVDGFFSCHAQMINSMRGCVMHNKLWPWPISSWSLSHDFAIKLLKYGESYSDHSTAHTVLGGFFPYFSCDQAALCMLFSVRLSVCLSNCHSFLTMFPSLYHHEISGSYYQWPG